MMVRRLHVGLRSVLLFILIVAASSSCLSLPVRDTPRRAGPTVEPTATIRATSLPRSTVARPLPTPSPSPTLDLAARIRANPMPPRDYAQLAGSLLGSGKDVPRVVRQTPVTVHVGDKKRFWIADLDSIHFHAITATLRVQGEMVQMWVQDGVDAEQSALERSTRAFDERIYPTNRASFGEEWSPGVDGERRIVVLNGRFSGAAGYFASANEYSRLVNPYSNEHEMFVMNIDALSPGSAEYEAVLAHEFQHMIHWNVDLNEDTWLNEGASELAEELNGFPWPRGQVAQFELNPDLQLNTWSDEPGHYGAAYLVLRYSLNRFGPEMLRSLVQHQDNGIASFDSVLAMHGTGLTFDDLFADWLLANALDDPELDPRFGYPVVDIQVENSVEIDSYPYVHSDSVRQYAADYVLAVAGSEGALQIRFEGEPHVKLVPNEAASGRFQWWSNRGDASHSYLGRTFDLTEATTATLTYNLWYDIEAGWDYGYVRASIDGGNTWELVRGRQMTGYDPVGNALGVGYTAKSGVPLSEVESGRAVWVEEALDLDAFCGYEVQLRFEYVTDDAINESGLCIDDITLLPFGSTDDVESGENGWRASGFIRHDNLLPQRYILQVVEFAREPSPKSPQIRRIPVRSDGSAEWTIPSFGGDIGSILLIVSAVAPRTTESTSYTVELEQLSEPPYKSVHLSR